MAKNDIRADIEKRALGAMLSSAFFTWPSAVNIAFFLFMFLVNVHPFEFWQSWFWVVLGVLAEGIYLGATITDPEASREAVRRGLTEKFSPGSIRNLSARQQMQKAMEYKSLIDKYADSQSGALKSSLQQTASEINDWIARIYKLAKNIDTFEANTVVNRDRQNVPTEIANLKRRMAAETDPGVKSELAEAVRIREGLLTNLQSIANTAKRAEIQMDNTLAQLATVYSQMQLISAKDLDSGRAQRLRDDIREEISSLSDTISAMDDVYHQQGYTDTVNNLAADDTSGATDTNQQSSQSSQQSQGGTRRN